MKSVIKIIFTLIMVLSVIMCVCMISHAQDDVTLIINGEKVKCDVPPIIINERTMVPVRVLFEYYSADVAWDGNLNQAVIKTDDTVMIFNINSKLMHINGEAVILDVAPVIVSGRTLVPVRFISENLNYNVEWDSDTRSVYVTQIHNAYPDDEFENTYTPVLPDPEYTPGPEPEIKPNPEIQPEPEPEDKPSAKPDVDSEEENEVDKITLSSIKIKETSSTHEITVTLSDKVNPIIKVLDDPNRLILDFYGVNQTIDDKKVNSDSDYIIQTRWATHPKYTRIVVESTEKLDYTISYPNGRNCKITIDIPEDKPEIIVPVGAPIVVLDAGHGGYDPGAQGKDEDGKVLLKEKDVCLDIVKRVKPKLEASGVKVVLTRSRDVALGDGEANDLYARADIANEVNASLFVSIHNNAFTTDVPHGTCVLYAGLETNKDYGITGKEVARNIQNYMVEYTGLYDRGIVERPGLAVLRKTVMPAVLVECAFITNADDREVLASDDGREEMAVAINDGIIKSLKQMGYFK